ncbi:MULTISPECIES: NblA/ycf18 family protein [unclassified Microcoleus]|uniref:NblA/ycf18 family protein n=1 Tax=unclassified Microcoleus TaxID=2642155 RepID=UPI002FCFD611
MKKLEVELTLEQEFKLKIYASQVQSLSAEQARILLVEIMRQNTIKDNVIKNLLFPSK